MDTSTGRFRGFIEWFYYPGRFESPAGRIGDLRGQSTKEDGVHMTFRSERHKYTICCTW